MGGEDFVNLSQSDVSRQQNSDSNVTPSCPRLCARLTPTMYSWGVQTCPNDNTTSNVRVDSAANQPIRICKKPKSEV